MCIFLICLNAVRFESTADTGTLLQWLPKFARSVCLLYSMFDGFIHSVLMPAVRCCYVLAEHYFGCMYIGLDLIWSDEAAFLETWHAPWRPLCQIRTAGATKIGSVNWSLLRTLYNSLWCTCLRYNKQFMILCVGAQCMSYYIYIGYFNQFLLVQRVAD